MVLRCGVLICHGTVRLQREASAPSCAEAKLNGDAEEWPGEEWSCVRQKQRLQNQPG
jgi:hypothetical protein